jgi:cytochrome c oxidase subunit IV
MASNHNHTGSDNPDEEQTKVEGPARKQTSERAPANAVTSPSDDDEDDEDEADPALTPGSEHRPDQVIRSTSGLQTIEAKAEPPDVRDEHEHDEHHGLAHTTPLSLLVAVLSALLVLTIITVIVTKVDLGGQGNLLVAMVIATVKAALVVTYFMHLRWDRKVHLVLFLSSVLFVILFLSMALTDRSEYQRSIDQLEEVQASTE